MTLTQINAELLAKLRAAVGGIGYLARYAGMNVAEWEQWEREAREVIHTAEAEREKIRERASRRFMPASQ